MKEYILTLGMLFGSFAIALIGPVHAYLQDGEIINLYQTRLPFLQNEPNTEFAINLIWQGFISACGFPGMAVVEGMFLGKYDLIVGRKNSEYRIFLNINFHRIGK